MTRPREAIGRVRCLALLGVAAAVASFSWPAAAQSVHGIAAVVNDDVVSVYDLVARINVVVSQLGVKDRATVRQSLRRQVLRNLIREKLQSQEAARLNVKVGDDEYARAIALIEKQNGVPPGKFDDFLRRRRLDPQSFKNQMRAQLSWSKFIRDKIRPTVSVSDEEIDETLARLRAQKGLTEYLIAEIVVGVTSAEEEDEARRGALRLIEQIRRGARFAAMARQFSESPTAAVGGQIGWVIEGRMAPEIDAALAKMEPGAISAPVRTPSGYHILALRKKRSVQGADADQARLSLTQVLLPLAVGAPPADVAAQRALARTLGETAVDCADMVKLAKEVKAPGSGDLGTVKAGDLPPALRRAVATLPVGKASAPVRTGRGIHVLMVCHREAPAVAPPDRRKIRRELLGRHIEVRVRRYLRDLYQSAHIDIRL